MFAPMQRELRRACIVRATLSSAGHFLDATNSETLKGQSGLIHAQPGERSD
jgi:hypothetical protein